MIAALKRAVAQLIGLAPVLPPIGELRKGYLKQAGYRVAHNQGRWFWRKSYNGAFSGRYTTEAAAWQAAAEDHDKETA
jgi:hypothetical protein